MADDTKASCRIENVLQGAAAGQDVVSKFNAECSLPERREAINAIQTQGKSTDSTLSGTHAAAMLGGFKIEYDSVKRTLDHIQAPGGVATAPPRDGAHSPTGKSGRTAETAPRPDAPARASSAPDTGRPGVDDAYTRASRQNLSFDERTLATKVEKDLLAGKDVSQTLNGLDRDAKVRVMSEVKGHLAETPGVKVKVDQSSGPDSPRYVSIETADGNKVLITESKFGSPQDIVQRGGHFWSKYTGSNDVYNRPGEEPAKSSGSGSSWVQGLLGKPLSEGDGPLARIRRGEEITDAEAADLRKKGLLRDVPQRPGSE